MAIQLLARLPMYGKRHGNAAASSVALYDKVLQHANNNSWRRHMDLVKAQLETSLLVPLLHHPYRSQHFLLERGGWGEAEAFDYFGATLSAPLYRHEDFDSFALLGSLIAKSPDWLATTELQQHCLRRNWALGRAPATLCTIACEPLSLLLPT